MVKAISREQIRGKLEAFLDSSFGTPAPEHLTFVEVGSSLDYDRIHIQNAIHMTPTQVVRSARTCLPNLGTEVVVYGDAAHQNATRLAADALSEQGYENIFFYSEGKEDWIGAGLWTNTSLVPTDGFSNRL